MGIVSTQPWLEHSQKNYKKKKNVVLASFLVKPVQDRLKKKNKFRFGYHFDLLGLEHSQKIQKKRNKIQKIKKKKKKNVILTSFLAKPWWDKQKKRKINFVPDTVST